MRAGMHVMRAAARGRESPVCVSPTRVWEGFVHNGTGRAGLCVRCAGFAALRRATPVSRFRRRLPGAGLAVERGLAAASHLVDGGAPFENELLENAGEGAAVALLAERGADVGAELFVEVELVLCVVFVGHVVRNITRTWRWYRPPRPAQRAGSGRHGRSAPDEEERSQVEGRRLRSTPIPRQMAPTRRWYFGIVRPGRYRYFAHHVGAIEGVM